MKLKITSLLLLWIPLCLQAQENPDKQNALIYYNIALSSR
jgi:hypothetical protein